MQPLQWSPWAAPHSRCWPGWTGSGRWRAPDPAASLPSQDQSAAALCRGRAGERRANPRRSGLPSDSERSRPAGWLHIGQTSPKMSVVSFRCCRLSCGSNLVCCASSAVGVRSMTSSRAKGAVSWTVRVYRRTISLPDAAALPLTQIHFTLTDEVFFLSLAPNKQPRPDSPLALSLSLSSACSDLSGYS